MITRLESEQSVKEYLDIMDHRKTEQLIDTLDKVEQNRKECYIREFSIEHFHDSKVFETLIPKICKIFREENEELTGFENEEILAEYQIYKTPGYVYMKETYRFTALGSRLQISVLSRKESLLRWGVRRMYRISVRIRRLIKYSQLKI